MHSDSGLMQVDGSARPDRLAGTDGCLWSRWVSWSSWVLGLLMEEIDPLIYWVLAARQVSVQIFCYPFRWRDGNLDQLGQKVAYECHLQSPVNLAKDASEI